MVINSSQDNETADKKDSSGPTITESILLVTLTSLLLFGSTEIDDLTDTPGGA